MDTPAVIRPVVAEDFDQWLPLWDGYNAFYGRADATALPIHITRTTWTRFFDEREPVHALVAQIDGSLVGLAHYLFHRSTISVQPTCYLQDLFASESARGRGIGGALIDTVRQQAKDAGSARLYWHTHETNVAAKRLYDQLAERSGFIVYRQPL